VSSKLCAITILCIARHAFSDVSFAPVAFHIRKRRAEELPQLYFFISRISLASIHSNLNFLFNFDQNQTVFYFVKSDGISYA
jgi:hypothetical protein